jgi:uncharacterized protein (DUF2235 family)
MKRIIVCCDGTWNNADTQTTDTNVAILARSIHANQETGGVLQVVLYLSGVGTSGLHLETMIEGATGFGIDDNIRSAYMFVAQNYVPGDEVFLFGFSRGAFTARSLAGFIAACGVLKRQKLGDLAVAWHYYRTAVTRSPRDFVATCHSDCHVDAAIKFLGVWDTVGSLGIPGTLFSELDQRRYGFLNTGPSSVVKRGCHAMAIEEHRDAFVPTPWTGAAPADVRIEQVWFAGAHSDVGGGYATRALADIPLVWMAKKAEEEGLALDWTCLPNPTNLDPLAPTHDSRTLVFAADRLRPTWRVVLSPLGGASFDVSLLDHLRDHVYAPVDENGAPLAVIGESIHASAVQRYGKTASFCVDDVKGDSARQEWRPKNLTPFFDGGGALKPGIPVSA